MRHRCTTKKTSRRSGYYRAMFRNLVIALIEHGGIRTTVSRAKALKMFVEPLVTLAKKNSIANKRILYKRLHHRVSVLKLFDDLAQRYQDRPGGYTRVIHCGFRSGDCAPMAYIEFVDRPPIDELDSTTGTSKNLA